MTSSSPSRTSITDDALAELVARPRPKPAPRSLYDPERDELSALLDGEPRYRLDQLWDGIHAQNREPADITTLPGKLRERLASVLPPALETVLESVSDDGDTIKWLWRLHDGATVETVLMHYDDRSTVCISSQAGCAMACGFCATGQAGFERHLTVGEIVEQVVRARRRSGDRRVSNVVFMGMGEPLANFDTVWAATRRIHGDLGLSARHITISTVGVVPGIDRLASAELPVNLAVSLHAADDELRDQLVPLNRRYPIASLRESCANYLEAKGRRLSFEWALIDGVNDREKDLDSLAPLARDLRAHVNLIPLNPTPGYLTKGTPPNRVRAFAEDLRSRGVNATIRQNRGTEIDAACGQLRAQHSVAGATATPVSISEPTTSSDRRA